MLDVKYKTNYRDLLLLLTDENKKIPKMKEIEFVKNFKQYTNI